MQMNIYAFSKEKTGQGQWNKLEGVFPLVSKASHAYMTNRCTPITEI